MRHAIQLSLILMVLAGCSGGGRLIIGEIIGPLSTNEDTSVQFEVTATGDTDITYQWSVDPVSAGTWENVTSSVATFNAASVLGDTVVTINVLVSSVKYDPVLKYFDFTIRETGGLVVGEIHGPTTVQAESSVSYTVPASGDTGITYAWLIDPLSAGTMEGINSSTMTLNAASPTDDLDATISVAVDSDDGGAELRYLDIVIEKYAPPVGWARTFGGDGADECRGIAIDDPGNIYLTGRFSDSVDFDPSSGTEVHTPVGDEDVFLSKFQPDGDLEWAVTWGGIYTDIALAVASDGAGSVYVAGRFIGTVDFDPGPAVDPHSSFSLLAADAFLSKFDSHGNYQWVVTWQADYERDEGLDVAVDDAGDVYVTYNYGYTTLVKFDSYGAVIWDRSWEALGNGVAVGPSDLVYVTGSFTGTVDFDPGSGTDYVSDGDVYLNSLDSDGEYAGVRTWDGTDASCVASDSDGNIYAAGLFSGFADLEPGISTEMHSSNGFNDVFLSRFDSSAEFLWVRTWGAVDDHDLVSALAVDSSGAAYVAGSFYGPVDFDPGAGTDNISSAGLNDAFLDKLDESGEFAWARTFGGLGDDSARAVAIDSSGNIYLAGDFELSVDFDPRTGTEVHTSHGHSDVFLLRLSPDGSW